MFACLRLAKLHHRNAEKYEWLLIENTVIASRKLALFASPNWKV